MHDEISYWNSEGEKFSTARMMWLQQSIVTKHDYEALQDEVGWKPVGWWYDPF